MPKRDPWVALARAYKANRGIRLSADDVRRLGNSDGAIEAAAQNCDTECTCDIQQFGVQCPYCDNDEDVDAAKEGR